MFCNPASAIRGECDIDCDCDIDNEGASEEGSDRGGGLLEYEPDGVMEGGVDMIFSIERESGL